MRSDLRATGLAARLTSVPTRLLLLLLSLFSLPPALLIGVSPALGASGQGLQPQTQSLPAPPLHLGEPLALGIPVPDVPPGSVPGALPMVRIALGDVFGTHRDSLALLIPSPQTDSDSLSVYKIEDGVPVPAVSLPDLKLLAHALSVVDATGNGRAEIWFGSVPGIDCLEWDGSAFPALHPWNRWQNKPVVLAALTGSDGPERLLALGAYYSEEAGIGLITLWWRDSMWGKAYEVRPEAFYHPEDRFAVGDVNGDGISEVVVASSKARGQLPREPLTVLALKKDETLAVFPGVFPDAVACADFNGNGLAELYYIVNLPMSCTAPETARLKGVEWNGSSFGEFLSLDLRGRIVTDLAVGDLDGDGRSNLYLAALARKTQDFTLSIETLNAATTKEAQ